MPRIRPNRPIVSNVTTQTQPSDEEALFMSEPEVIRETSDHRDPIRPAMRPEMRADDPRARAAARTAQLREAGALSVEGGENKFYVDMSDVPDGWTYEWKTKSVLGKEDPAYQVGLARTGWEPVPADRHPHMMPQGKYSTIERDGMVLMERPKEISDAMRKKDLDEARRRVQIKEEQLNSAPAGQFQRNKSDGTNLAKVSKHYEPMPIPNE